jgi:hypothetical protein
MMADGKPEKENEVTPEGAVEVDESDLDQASGGISSYSTPTDSFSLNYSKIDTNLAGQKVAPTVIVGAGPGAGPHIAPSDPTKTG